MLSSILEKLPIKTDNTLRPQNKLKSVQTQTSKDEKKLIKYYNFIQFYLCGIINNPILSSCIVICYILISQFKYIIDKDSYFEELETSSSSSLLFRTIPKLNEIFQIHLPYPNYLSMDSLYKDILSQFITLLFIFRFKNLPKSLETLSNQFQNTNTTTNSKFSKRINSIIIEILLFGLSIFFLIFIIFQTKLEEIKNLKSLFLLQYLIIYSILFIDLIFKDKSSTILKFCQNLNNNFLKIIISFNFILIIDINDINSNFIYLLSQYSIKFFCLWIMILDEIKIYYIDLLNLNQYNDNDNEHEVKQIEKFNDEYYDYYYSFDDDYYILNQKLDTDFEKFGKVEKDQNNEKRFVNFNNINLKDFILSLTCIMILFLDFYNLYYNR
ncbi:uncharacterized protein KGF55_005023 [Candida pseudojiufengensis]|uniref:uncharacterized protein n=1 Tax=Candida pseudojiufengensis TaxID=497109 RepID=UPI002224D292|nr:uncharacterized protein KGF55_005023 [Candida pseudojiufengensis]KAI5959791.1 hypothetical protein KGF55_005023 [Candida pseudojiufengensis]